ncbi:ATP-binding protein [Roseisolibacter sp. H3M3-2]|uniref:two-component system sensor histidine kinase NtrB n=1 Tax=Roseisolibacter sp. H3M3-2 TaxID=3031323 RepID=UPI0023D9DF19|nr:ATP-binding protein [Roseisolibacter sp. H3M3-2]MDF1501949.1 ATP-binding protein [Roseisolibacter sp. H3M3-2]
MPASLLPTLVTLAAGHAEPFDALPAALDAVRTAHALDAVELTGAGRSWRAGEGARESATAGLPLRAAGRMVGTLTLIGEGAARAAGALAAEADLLALLVAGGNRAATLTAERDTRAAELDEQRRFAEGVVDALPLGVYVIDRDYRIQFWNRKREVDTQGLAREAALGRSIFDVMVRQNASLMRAEFDQVFASGQMQQLQLESRSTGELRTYRMSKIPMRDASGAVTHVVTVGEDVTEWKAAMERTAQAEKLAAIGQLAAGVMHEINNPLATIAACAETMTSTLADLPRAQQPLGFGEYLRIIDHEVHRCRGIAEGLLNFSRAKPLQRVSVGLNTVVESTLFLLKHHSRFKRCLVRLDLEEGVGPRVMCDPDQITQVTMALLLNAADAVDGIVRGEDEAQAAVTLRTREAADGAAVLEIEDEGTGIARDALAKIFEPFYTTKEPGAGTGLGLAICYGIVRDHGGRIAVDSEPGQGSTFRVLLPLAA